MTNKSGSFWQLKYYSNIEFLNQCLSVHPRVKDFSSTPFLLMVYFSFMFPALECLCFRKQFYRDSLIFNRWSGDVSDESTASRNIFLLTVQAKLVHNTLTSF